MKLIAALLGSVLLAAPAQAEIPFSAETVPFNDDIGQWLDLAIDSKGNPHIVCYNADVADLMYMTRVGDTWIVETAASGNIVGQYASIALDSNDIPHVSYFDGEAGTARYANRVGGTWSNEVIPDIGFYGQWTSIAVNSNGDPLVAYQNLTENSVTVQVRTSGVWSAFGDYGFGGTVAEYISLLLDSNDHYHIVYYDATDHQIDYIRRIEISTLTTNLTGGLIDEGQYCDAVIGPNDRLHVSFKNEVTDDLMYAVHDQPGTVGASWTFEIVDDGDANVVGHWTSIGLDQAGNPHIAYRNNDKQGLEYAYKTSTSWVLEVPDGSHERTGEYTSLVMDRQGNPHIAHYSDDDNLPRYLSAGVKIVSPNAGETWAVGSTQTVKWSGAGKVDVSLAVDGVSFDHILGSNVVARSITLTVPHLPTRFAKVQVMRSSWFADAESDSFFTIDASVILTSLKAQPRPDGMLLLWSTTPGPEANMRYRVERQEPGKNFMALHPGLIEVQEYLDTAPVNGSTYKLFAVNGLGGETSLGETTSGPTLGAGSVLAVRPNPAPGGKTTIMYRSLGQLPVTVEIFDMAGRRVQTVFQGIASGPEDSVRWDGRNAQGQPVVPGVYFVRISQPGGLKTTSRIVVTP